MTDSPSSGEIERFHPTYCKKYIVLRGIYPNDRRLSGNPCSCGFDETVKADRANLVQRILSERPAPLNTYIPAGAENSYGAGDKNGHNECLAEYTAAIERVAKEMQ